MRRWMLLSLLSVAWLSAGAARAESQPKAEAKPEAKTEAKPEAKTEAKTETKTDAPSADAEGFAPLFNGKDMTGWEIKAGKPEAWKAKDGMLVCSGGGGGWIGTTAEYGDFVLRLEWKLPTDGNSGVFLRAPAKGDPAFAGMEIQVLDDTGPAFKGKIAAWQHSGSVYAAVAPSKSVYKPGEWNSYEITCHGSKIKIVFNGETVVDIDASEPPYNAPLNKHSALSSRPRKGFIGFQNHGSGVEYRNVRIKVIEPTK